METTPTTQTTRMSTVPQPPVTTRRVDATPRVDAPPMSIFQMSFGGGYRVSNLLFFPIIFAVLAFFVDKALVDRVTEENHTKFQFLRATPHVLYGIATCVIFAPEWIRAGWFRGLLSFAIVMYAKMTIAAVYTTVTARVLNRLQTRAVSRDASKAE
eukprot:jgi/Mesvir1/18493/Mv14338-RA.1